MKETKHAAAEPAARAAMHEVMAAFEAFKAANDERLAALERRGGDMLLEEKVARIDAGLQAAQGRLDRALAEGRRPALAASEGRSIVPDERKAAWDGYLKTGAAAMLALEAKGLSEGVPTAGGYVAPPETERLIERRLQMSSPMRDIATVRTIGAGVFRKPVSTAGIESGWVAETDARPETDAPVLALLEFPAADLYASPAATQALLDDAFVNLDEWLAAECEDAFAGQETEAFVNGDGINKPKGFLSYAKVADAAQAWGEIGYILSGAAGDFAAADPVDRIIDLIYAPKARYRANGRFVMNRRTAAKIRKFKDADGNYIWSPATAPGAPATLLGYPAVEIETMPDVAANSFVLAFGDFAKGYLIVDRAGVRVLRDPYSAKPFVLFYTTKRVGGGVQNFDAVKLMKFAAS
ncbi:MAG: phage major capsid protein [Pseudomonadota bacterium]